MATITCGNCKATHASAGIVRECYAETRYYEEIAASERAAEARNERWFEERGSLTAEPDPYGDMARFYAGETYIGD